MPRKLGMRNGSQSTVWVQINLDVAELEFSVILRGICIPPSGTGLGLFSDLAMVQSSQNKSGSNAHAPFCKIVNLELMQVKSQT